MKQSYPIQTQLLTAVMLAGLGGVPAWRAQAQENPFNGYPFDLPSTIEAEMFDTGGLNSGYFNSSNTNTPGKYRTDGVCIYRCADYGGNTGYCVGNTWPNDWLAYTVTCWETATYRIDVRARIAQPTTSTCSFHVEINGTNVTGPMTLSDSSTNWQVVSATTTSPITAAGHKLVLKFDSGDPNYGVGFFDYLTIYKLPPWPSNAGYTTTVTLSTNTDMGTAKANATTLQNAINSLPPGGGTIQLSGSGPYYICQANPGETSVTTYQYASARPPLVLNVTHFSGNLRNDYSGYVGFQFRTGNSQVLVASLGRWIYSGGSSGSHNLVLADSGGNILAQATLNATNYEPGFFAYTNLSSPVTLNANTTYAVMSQETWGGDGWFDNQGTDITLDSVASGAWGCYAGTLPGQYTLAAYSSGQTYGPVSLQYVANPKWPSDNYAVEIGVNNVTIQGAPTTLVAFNRDTTIFQVGSGEGGIPSTNVVSGIVLTNLVFQGNPLIDYTGAYNTFGLVRTVNTAWGLFDPLGALVAFGGYQVPNTNTMYLSQNLAVQGCTFYNPSSVGISLRYLKDVVVTNSGFSYFNGISPALADEVWAWCGILELTTWVEDVAVLNCAFNGNASMGSAADYGADGLVWLSNGGKWIVENCAITNYHFEAVQLDAGPYTVVSNAFCTLSTNIATCALNTMHSDNTNTLSAANSIQSDYWFVGNAVDTIGNLGGGLLGIRDPGMTTGPYNLILSGNEFNLTTNHPPNNLSFMLMAAAAQNVIVTGNLLDYSIHALNYTTANGSNQKCNIYTLCNDFKNAAGTSLFVQDSGNRLASATLIANNLGSGIWQNVYLSLATPYVYPVLGLHGNRFFTNGSSSSWTFYPTLLPYTYQGPDLYLNFTGVYEINATNEYDDANYSLF